MQQLKAKVVTKTKAEMDNPSIQSLSTQQNIKILPKKTEEVKKRVLAKPGLKIEQNKDVTSPSQRYATANTLHENQAQQKDTGAQ